MELMGSIILVAVWSRKSNILRSPIVKSDQTPTDSEQMELSTNRGRMTIMQALMRFMLNCSCKNAIATSPKDMVEVKAATVNKKKNSTDHNCVNGIWAKISGKVTKTNADPAILWSDSPNVMTPGNIMIPIKNATDKSSSDTVIAVRVNLVSFG